MKLTPELAIHPTWGFCYGQIYSWN